MDSILTLIKKLLGIEEEYEHFDTDIIIGVNTAFATLNQLGIGPENGFSIQDKSAVWLDFIGDRKDLEAVKTFVFLNTKLGFDPPQNAFLVEAMKNQINELAWRLNVQVETPIDKKEGMIRCPIIP